MCCCLLHVLAVQRKRPPYTSFVHWEMPSHCCFWRYPDTVHEYNASEQASGMFNVQKPSLNPFFLPQKTYSWDSVLKSEGFEAIFDLLNLLLKWHSHFCSLFPFFFFPEPGIIPLDTTFGPFRRGFTRIDYEGLLWPAAPTWGVSEIQHLIWFVFVSPKDGFYRLIVANVLEGPC